jgi:hypothetical protein
VAVVANMFRFHFGFCVTLSVCVVGKKTLASLVIDS